MKLRKTIVIASLFLVIAYLAVTNNQKKNISVKKDEIIQRKVILNMKNNKKENKKEDKIIRKKLKTSNVNNIRYKKELVLLNEKVIIKNKEIESSNYQPVQPFSWLVQLHLQLICGLKYRV